MGQWVSASAQIRSLAKAVSAAFAASALTAEEKWPGKVEITDLAWCAPPLEITAELGGVPLSEYLNAPIHLDQANLQRFWEQTLDDMWVKPSTIMRRGTLKNCGWAMPKMPLGQRAYYFSEPEGFPGQLDELSAFTFSMELAHIAGQSLPLFAFVSDEDNYYAEFSDGQRIGVINGKVPGSWQGSIAGQVQDLLGMGRGHTDYTCRFDHIAQLRSVLNVHRSRFPHNFEALDWALQALRLLSHGGHCPELITGMRIEAIDVPLTRTKEHALASAISLMSDRLISDRSKLHGIRGLLVPDVISGWAFKQNIFTGDQFPFALAPGKSEKITAWLKQEYQSQIPRDLQTLGD